MKKPSHLQCAGKACIDGCTLKRPVQFGGRRPIVLEDLGVERVLETNKGIVMHCLFCHSVWKALYRNPGIGFMPGSWKCDHTSPNKIVREYHTKLKALLGPGASYRIGARAEWNAPHNVMDAAKKLSRDFDNYVTNVTTND